MSYKNETLRACTVEEKRKSAVLIAAQSLDLEVQNVKKLKRLSVGSMDLLLDPEFEYTMGSTNDSNSNTNTNTNTKKNLRKSRLFDNDNSLMECEVSENYDDIANLDSTSDLTSANVSDLANDNSFDKTGIEYLHNEDFEHVHTNENNNYTLGEEPNINESLFQSHKNNSQLRRGLSGVHSLNRGNSKQLKPKIQNKQTETEDQITQNLLWVPANKHPGVKPENYVELLQDTLQNINLNLNETQNNVEDTSNKTSDKMVMDREVIRRRRISQDLNRNHSSLVRRPTGLRISYSESVEEFHDALESENSLNSDKEREPSLSQNSISMITIDLQNKSTYQMGKNYASLKDITEELTKISNKAGLSNSDAISLARSLSIAGSVSKTDNSVSDNLQSATQGNDDNKPRSSEVSEAGYASNILVRNGITMPTRSLRRSKFNTYKIRNPSGNILEQSRISKSEPSSRNVTGSSNRASSFDIEHTQDVLRESAPLTFETISEEQVQDKSLDAIDILDKSLDISDKDFDSSHLSFSQGNITQSSDSSNDSVLVRPAYSHSIIQEKLDTDRGGDLEFSSNKFSETLFAKESDIQDDPDFVNLSIPERTKSQRVRAEKSNHSKHRHSPIITISEETPFKINNKKQLSQPLLNESEINKGDHGSIIPENLKHKASVKEASSKEKEPSTNKKQRFDKKIVSIFKRKSSKTSNNEIKNEKKTVLSQEDKRIMSSSSSKSTKQDISAAELQSDHLDDSLRTVERELLSESVHPTEVNIPVGTQSNSLDSKPIEIANTSYEDKLNSSYDENAEDSFSYLEESLETQNSLQPAVCITSNRADVVVTETVDELSDGDDSQDITGGEFYTDNTQVNTINTSYETSYNSTRIVEQEANTLPESSLPARKLTFKDVVKPERPNGPMEFTDSAFGFPLPKLTTSTVIMFDHRLPVNVERAIYRLSHLKLSDPKRELREQILLSNFMYAYLHLVNHSLYIEQAEQQAKESNMDTSEYDNSVVEVAYLDDSFTYSKQTKNNTGSDYLNNDVTNDYHTERNAADGSICIPDLSE
ncbi:hypothetical protein TPHA_0I00200 [Tetrapisispora phaffii CBS 4417]|uniref:Protein Zds1 C-terminal domain-containing protein n=1 Tax=Tetrapisispora phaffii (strain ATCC 24235 / CBS 4417 / NBRC 1672 / NRRL Y-8282 / UCD 70-5) TaxID=1071381 RepID=G8BX99_TETPH|nr:hypothetical protein TPHA_0I00200 [Tetrapisispora phaffii CBS 4417]CCE64527.1 hypothetical protein TPHA_0I00200 [Tetrapisispora phaffii CBS 4417]